MLPPKIASEICSLTPGQERLTVSVVFKVNPQTGVVSDEETWIGKSIIKSGGKLSYKEVDAILGGQVDTKIEGAEAKDIQILYVSLNYPLQTILYLSNLRLSLRSSASLVLARMERLLLLCDSFISWTMKMFQWSTTSSIPQPPTN